MRRHDLSRSPTLIGGEKIFAFCHIPKTAGSTLNVALRQYFGGKLMAARGRLAGDRICRPEDLLFDLRLFPQIACITGHGLRPFVDMGSLEQRLCWFTFLRDPVERFLSQYVHEQTGKHARLRMGLNEWADRYDRSNYQVKWIAGEKDPDAAIQILKEKFRFVGLADNFESSLEKFQATFELKGFKTTPPRTRMAIRDASLKDDILGNWKKYEPTIVENTSLDRKLYLEAKEVWPISLTSQNLESNRTPAPSLSQRYRHLEFRLKDKLVYAPVWWIRNRLHVR